jgi:hypothetical protein
MPVVYVYHTVAPVGFDDWRDQRNDFRADLADVRRFVDGEAVTRSINAVGAPVSGEWIVPVM